MTFSDIDFWLILGGLLIVHCVLTVLVAYFLWR
jgi:hypothetical protein